MDIESAYRLVPVHPHDRSLLGLRLGDNVYIDPMLPFGLRSAPKIFTAIADALEWCLKSAGIAHVHHYLDDFVVVGSSGTTECSRALDILISKCTELGVPLATHKTEGPATSITFLGIVIDTARGELRLPAAKLEHLRSLVADWAGRKACNRKELESLVGHLNHACKVVRPGRSFLRRMIVLLQRYRNRYQPLRLNHGFRSDLQWWACFASQWNGSSYIATAAHVRFATDASGIWGCGAWHERSWFQLEWDPLTRQLPIAVKELLPIILAGLIWGKSWRRQKVLCYCDNQAVVAGLRSRSSPQPQIMHLLRCLFFVEALYLFEIEATYIRSEDNSIADDLSRDNMCSFYSKVPLADKDPAPVPRTAVNLLLDQSGDWTSPAWMRQFSAFFTMA